MDNNVSALINSFSSVACNACARDCVLLSSRFSIGARFGAIHVQTVKLLDAWSVMFVYLEEVRPSNRTDPSLCFGQHNDNWDLIILLASYG